MSFGSSLPLYPHLEKAVSQLKQATPQHPLLFFSRGQKQSTHSIFLFFFLFCGGGVCRSRTPTPIRGGSGKFKYWLCLTSSTWNLYSTQIFLNSWPADQSSKTTFKRKFQSDLTCIGHRFETRPQFDKEILLCIFKTKGQQNQTLLHSSPSPVTGRIWYYKK